MLKKFEDAKNKMEQANEDYKKLRDSCKHAGIKTWKPKYNGYFCEDCERFLPTSGGLMEDTVDLNAIQYEWNCPKCDNQNIEGRVPIIGTAIGEVTCTECKKTFPIHMYYHNYDR
jgi:hypothetical protein